MRIYKVKIDTTNPVLIMGDDELKKFIGESVKTLVAGPMDIRIEPVRRGEIMEAAEVEK